jgi:hypothetical protein
MSTRYMFLQWWRVPAGPGVVLDLAGGVLDPAGGAVAGLDDGAPDADVDADGDDVVEATAESEPLAAAIATPVAPAPMPAATSAVMIRRWPRPFLMGVM